MKKNKILAVSLIGLLLAGALFFAGCEEEEEEPLPGANCFANVKCSYDPANVEAAVWCGMNAITADDAKKALKCKVYKDMLMLDPDDIPTTGILKCDC